MKQSKTARKDMTIEEVFNILVYRPYRNKLSVMVTEDERICFRGETWSVILDHNTGEFHFDGRLDRFYDIDMIESIRDSFGDIYSWYNIRYDSIPVATWMEVSDEEETKGPGNWYSRMDKERRDAFLARKREYYRTHREEERNKQRAYIRRKKEEEGQKA